MAESLGHSDTSPRLPPYPRTTPGHACPLCGAWSPIRWDTRLPHHCNPPMRKKNDYAEADSATQHEGVA